MASRRNLHRTLHANRIFNGNTISHESYESYLYSTTDDESAGITNTQRISPFVLRGLAIDLI